MRIAHFVQCRYPLSGYGGTERATYWLAKAQAEAGHDVSIICEAGSSLPFARCVPFEHGFTDLTPYVPENTDIVHIRGTPQFRLDVPFLVTIDGNGQPGETYHPNSVFVSENHARRHGWSEFVHNGLDLADYEISQGPREESLLFLAKASWSVKNLEGAIRVARHSGRRLHVAGGRAPFWKLGVTSHGTVNDTEKKKLLAESRALIFPVLWDEPFGIAVIEALASGLPVLATRRGSLPELVDNSCGFLSDSFEELCVASRALNGFEPEACRARVEKLFDHRRMATKYEHYYKKVLSEGRLRDGRPEIPTGQNPAASVLQW